MAWGSVGFSGGAERKFFWRKSWTSWGLGQSVEQLGLGSRRIQLSDVPLPQNVRGENEITSPTLVFPILGP